MDEELRQLANLLRVGGDKSDVLVTWEILLALCVSLLCSMIVARVYKATHPGPSYSQSFAQTLVMTSLVTTVIMLVIGSNIARAFSLVGALSIIRFRNAVKETRDVSFIFFAMAIAMAAGTRFYNMALLGTAFISGVVGLFYAIDFGASALQAERILRVDVRPDVDPEEVLAPGLRVLFERWALVRLESVKGGLQHRVVLSVRPRQVTTAAKVLAEMSRLNDGLEVSYAQGQHTDDL